MIDDEQCTCMSIIHKGGKFILFLNFFNMISFILKVFSFDIMWRLTIDSGFFHFRFIKPLITWKRLWTLFTSNCGEWGRAVFIYCFWLMNKSFIKAKKRLFYYLKSFVMTFIYCSFKLTYAYFLNYTGIFIQSNTENDHTVSKNIVYVHDSFDWQI